MNSIKVYCANLPQREERRKHIKSEFISKPEFDLTIVPAIENKDNGSIGLYQTFLSILEIEKHSNDPYFIFVEDDHKFTNSYSLPYLKHSIATADSFGAEILVGGPTFIHLPVQSSQNLFWVRVFNGSQFLVIFKRIFMKYQDIINDKKMILDVSLSEIFNYTFAMYPPISEQKFFGYSDATPSLFENNENYLSNLSSGVNRRMYLLNRLRNIINQSITKS